MKKEKIPDFTEDDLVSAEIKSDTPSDIAKQMLDNERHSSNTGAIVSVGFFIAGIIVLFLGINGTINMEISTKIVNAKFINCCPGIVIIFISFLTFIFSRPKQKTY